MTELTCRVSVSLDSLPSHTTSTVAAHRDASLSGKPRVFRLLRHTEVESDDEDEESPPSTQQHVADPPVPRLEAPVTKANVDHVAKCARLEPLTRAESRVLDRAIAGSSEATESGVHGPLYAMEAANLKRLVHPDSWLDDTIIDAYMKLLN